MPVISTLSLWAAAVVAALAAFGKLHWPLHWGTTEFDGALAAVTLVCLWHAAMRLRRRSAMGAMRFGPSH